jgi:type VI secretion system secreted protein Hcp
MTSTRIASTLALLACCSLAAPVQAEMAAYMSVKAQKQGQIQGSVIQKGREGKIMVIAIDHFMTSPTDAASGQPTGKHMHKPLLITKEVDKSSPQLHASFATNENLPEVQIQFWAPNIKAAVGVGNEYQYYTVTLNNARITSVRHVMPNMKNPELQKYAAYEELALVYQKITWTWTDGGITFSDDWEARF